MSGVKNQSYLLAAGLAAVAVLVYLFAVQPGGVSLLKAQADLDALKAQQVNVDRDLTAATRVKTDLDKIAAARQSYIDGLLTPLLESYAMRAKSILDPFAADAGFQVDAYREQPVRALPLPQVVPLQLYARQPIEVTGHGGYAEIISFLLHVERDLPLVALEGLTITSQAQPDQQQAVLVFEWPVAGALSRPPAATKGGAK